MEWMISSQQVFSYLYYRLPYSDMGGGNQISNGARSINAGFPYSGVAETSATTLKRSLCPAFTDCMDEFSGFSSDCWFILCENSRKWSFLHKKKTRNTRLRTKKERRQPRQDFRSDYVILYSVIASPSKADPELRGGKEDSPEKNFDFFCNSLLCRRR
ncbi:hypothetical protein H6P81_016964 [Aristolochia fimbriata]|uniref:Uncharacterized protein n=1 Tax=Aristolochia fimbriata TaxID=158543 RepID=A0AAV7DWT6_ARIFI|nr:hypothetical protein H6P81_016964 [Aristolochia fimbriata]